MTSCNHCWHRAPYTHTIHTGPGEEHIDEVCCHCGQARCRTIVRVSSSLDGHGQHHPARAGEVLETIRMISGEPIARVSVRWGS